MANRTKFYFRQRVSEAELNLGFDLLEKADRDFASDINVYGIISGAEPSPHSPVPNLSIDLTAGARAYDHLGQRIYFGTGQVVDVSRDLGGIPTDVVASGNERWVTAFVRFKRAFSDPRTDGNSQQIMFRADESYELVVRQGPEGAAGSAPRPPLEAEELLVCDVLRRAGQTQIVQGDIDLVRRQAFVFAQSKQVSVAPQGWTVLTPLATATVQATFDKVDRELQGHFAGTSRKHPAGAVDFTPYKFLTTPTVQGAVNQLVDSFASQTTNTSGASRIGAPAVPGTPEALPAGTVATQLEALLDAANWHAGGVTYAHQASRISAQPHNTIAASDVQSQLQEIVTDLSSTMTGASGATLVGVDSIDGEPQGLAPGPLRAVLANLLGFVNAQRTAFGRDHAFGDDPGQHRAIHQPVLGSGRVLIFDSAASGWKLTRFRIYADGNSLSDSIWFCLNVAWDGTAWTRDEHTSSASAFRISPYDVAFHSRSGADTGTTFTTWSAIWRLPFGSINNTSFEISGNRVQEIGKLGMRCINTGSTTQTVNVGGSVNFRSRFANAPSSISLTVHISSSGTSANQTSTYDGDGFYYHCAASLAAGATGYWFGTYTAIA